MSDEWDEGFVESSGVRIHYTRTGGEKPPLVIAHGLFDDALCRTPLIRELEPDYDVIAYDARAHGRSDAPESGYEMDDRVADLVAVLDGLDVDRAILVGHSMGGSTVASTAARHPERVRGVVVIDPAGMLSFDGGDRTDEVREQIRWWHDHSKAALVEADDELRGHVEAGEEELAALLADARLRLSQRIVAIAREGYPDLGDVYPEIEAPTLILKADAEGDARARDEEIAALLPDGRLVHVDDAGHCVFRDQRTAATAELRAFLGAL
jgi:pimeloyl-ACP methyl ester carboxylesterase